MRGHLKKLLAKEPKFINTFVAILGSCMNNAMFTDNQHQGFIAFLRDILEQMDKEKPSSSRAPGDKKKVEEIFRKENIKFRSKFIQIIN